MWAREIDGAYTGTGLSISIETSGYVYIAGEFAGTADFDPGAGIYNLTSGATGGFILKLDINGNFNWGKMIGGISLLETKCLAIDLSGNVLITGAFMNTADFDPGPGLFNLTVTGNQPGLKDAFILKLNSSGNFIWAKQFGGNNITYCNSIVTDGIGNIITTGYFYGTSDFDPGIGTHYLIAPQNSSHIFISKLDANGNFIWVKQIPGGSAVSIDVDSFGNLLTTGPLYLTVDFDPGPGIFNLTSSGQMDVFVLKLDPDGNFLWAKSFGGPYDDRVASLAVGPDNNAYLTGVFAWQSDFDPGPGSYIMVATGNYDIYALKLNSSGNFSWAIRFGGDYFALANSVFVDNYNNVHITGGFTDTVDFDPGPGVHNLNNLPYNWDIFVEKIKQCAYNSFYTIAATACNTYILNGQTYTTSGTYTQVLVNSVGCDSILTLNLIINGSNTTTSVTACENYTWQGQIYTVSGFYSDTLISSTNCDSILNLNLIINYKVLSTVNATICEGQVYAGHTTTGTYVDTYIASNGCDSIRTLNLNVNPKLYTNFSTTICDDQSYGGHNTTGIYIDTLPSTFGCDSIRTLYLTVNPRAYTNINATICEGQTFYAGGAYQSTAGIYKDTLLTSLGCDSIITTDLKVNPKPRPDLGPDGNICMNKQSYISPGLFKSYLWQDNSAQPEYMVTSIGKYWVTVTDSNNCSATDTLNITTIDTIPNNFLPENRQLCYGDVLKINVPNYAAYNWSTGSTASAIDLSNFGTYYLTVKDFNNCTGTDSITLQRKNCIFIGIPNAFTPNGDNKNDIFKPGIFQSVKKFSFIVFNRHGQTVFETREYGKGWDGTLKGKPQPSGSYVYHIKYTNIFGVETVENGSVLLIR
jgi:gliding motility-associated-like protein